MTSNPHAQPAVCRVEEFLRQYAIPVRPHRMDSIAGIQVDRNLDYMANLYASDLRMILDELAELHDKRDTLVIERFQGTQGIATAAEEALDTRDRLQSGSNGSPHSRDTIARHDGRAAGLREALEILHGVTT